VKLLGVREAAVKLGVPETAIRSMLKAGRLSSVRVGSERGRNLIPEGQIISLGMTGRVEPALSTR